MSEEKAEVWLGKDVIVVNALTYFLRRFIFYSERQGGLEESLSNCSKLPGKLSTWLNQDQKIVRVLLKNWISINQHTY